MERVDHCGLSAERAITFEDTEGNVMSAMQADAGASF